MFTSHFHITAFIIFPLSAAMVISTVAMLVSREIHGNRWFYWYMPITLLYFGYLQITGTLGVIGETGGLHLLLLLMTGGNLWATFIISLALAIRRENELRAADRSLH